MGEAFMPRGGGGAALNFKVLAYATEEALLAATPAENTIGIITETPITSWIFSATEPSPAAAGMVWITTGTSSSAEFNALKKNAIQIYPISAKQYVGGAWVNVDAYSYQGGEWVDWVTYLYNLGDQCDSITGGWKAVNANGKMTFNDDHIAFTYSGSSDTHATVYTNNKIDLTGKTKVIAEVDVEQCNGVSTDLIVGLYNSNTDAKGTHIACAGTAKIGNGQVLELNVSSYQSEYYIGFRGSSAVGKLYNICSQ